MKTQAMEQQMNYLQNALKPVKNVEIINVWRFKEAYPGIWNRYAEAIITGINKDGFYIVEAKDSVKLTY